MQPSLVWWQHQDLSMLCCTILVLVSTLSNLFLQYSLNSHNFSHHRRKMFLAECNPSMCCQTNAPSVVPLEMETCQTLGRLGFLSNPTVVDCTYGLYGFFAINAQSEAVSQSHLFPDFIFIKFSVRIWLRISSKPGTIVTCCFYFHIFKVYDHI